VNNLFILILLVNKINDFVVKISGKQQIVWNEAWQIALKGSQVNIENYREFVSPIKFGSFNKKI